MQRSSEDPTRPPQGWREINTEAPTLPMRLYPEQKKAPTTDQLPDRPNRPTVVTGDLTTNPSSGMRPGLPAISTQTAPNYSCYDAKRHRRTRFNQLYELPVEGSEEFN